MNAVRCPVCEGSGKVPVSGMCQGVPEKTCHGCDGKGWVTVDPTNYIIQPVYQYDVHAT